MKKASGTMRGKVTAATPGRVFRLDGQRYEVAESCGGSSGHWLCLTHPDDEGMGLYKTQLQKDLHIQTGDHELVWVCPKHGPEAP